MDLCKALRLGSLPRLAFTGSGGKTTAMFSAARCLPPPVWVTTTTHLGVEQLELADLQLLYPVSEGEMKVPRDPASGVTVFTSGDAVERAAGLSIAQVQDLLQAADHSNIPLLVEADGSRTLPLKAPAAHEPVIPDWIEHVVVVAGLSGLGKSLTSEWVHRPEIFARLSGLSNGDLITHEALYRVLTHLKGGLKGIPSRARRTVLLNQVDCLKSHEEAHMLARRLLSHYDTALVATAQSDEVLAAYEPAAGILLAAGESRRLQRPKQLLNWRGEPLVRRVAKAALAGGCWPLIVVTGAYAAETEACLVDLPVQIVRNEAWQEGQASSIRTGIAALPGNIGSTFFLLTDQPQVPPELIRKLVAQHARNLSPVTAPLVEGRRANPVLFDRVTFKDLLKLTGDTGGRSLFERFPPEFVDWDDPSLLLDVDTPEDYLKLLDLE